MKYYPFVLLLLFFIYSYNGLAMLRMNSSSLINRVFFFFCASCAIWSCAYALVLTAQDYQASFYYYRISFLGLCTMAAFLLHLSLLFARIPSAKSFWLNLLIYLPGLILTWVLMNSNQIVYYNPLWVMFSTLSFPIRAAWISFGAYIFTYVSLTVYFLWRWGEYSRHNRFKKQSRIIMWAVALSAIFGVIIDILIPVIFTTSQYYTYTPVTILVIVICIAYALRTYRITELSPQMAADDIIAHSMDALILLNEQGTVLQCNPIACRMTQCSEKELLGTSLSSFLHLNEIAFSLKTGATLPELVGIETTIYGIYGEETPVRVFLSIIPDKLDEPLGYVLIAHDLTKTIQLKNEIIVRQNTKAELMESNRSLKNLDRMKTDFIATVSHELRTPLTSILGFSKLTAHNFEDKVLPNLDPANSKAVYAIRDMVGNMKIIISESIRLATLINDILDITKMETGQIEFKRDLVDIKSVIKQAATTTSVLFVEKPGLRYTETIAEDLPSVIADHDRLVQVMINLLSNAIKFTDAGYVAVQAALINGEIVIRVSDTGIGIRDEDFEAIFMKFKQLGTAVTGTGLGLPICKYIVERHGGNIWVESKPGSGSVFSFSLPLSYSLAWQ